jgi:hypothetical protein
LQGKGRSFRRGEAPSKKILPLSFEERGLRGEVNPINKKRKKLIVNTKDNKNRCRF